MTHIVCPHGIVPCTECRVKFNGYNNIDNNLKLDRLVELEQHKTRQIDENRKVSYRLDDLRLSIKDILLKICCLESDLDNLKKTVNYNSEITNDRLNVNKEEKPYICPVCDGKMRFKNEKLLPGERLNRFQTQDETGVYDVCQPCKGTGIVWS